MATSSGVVVAYPGLPLDSWYEPTRRSWYLRARQHPGRVVLSSPYLDAVSTPSSELGLGLTLVKGDRGWRDSGLKLQCRYMVDEVIHESCGFQGGAGYIVTLSQTITSKAGTVAAVMGMDMTIGYFYQVRFSQGMVNCLQLARY